MPAHEARPCPSCPFLSPLHHILVRRQLSLWYPHLLILRSPSSMSSASRTALTTAAGSSSKPNNSTPLKPFKAYTAADKAILCALYRKESAGGRRKAVKRGAWPRILLQWAKRQGYGVDTLPSPKQVRNKVYCLVFGDRRKAAEASKSHMAKRNLTQPSSASAAAMSSSRTHAWTAEEDDLFIDLCSTPEALEQPSQLKLFKHVFDEWKKHVDGKTISPRSTASFQARFHFLSNHDELPTYAPIVELRRIFGWGIPGSGTPSSGSGDASNSERDGEGITTAASQERRDVSAAAAETLPEPTADPISTTQQQQSEEAQQSSVTQRPADAVSLNAELQALRQQLKAIQDEQQNMWTSSEKAFDTISSKTASIARHLDQLEETIDASLLRMEGLSRSQKDGGRELEKMMERLQMLEEKEDAAWRESSPERGERRTRERERHGHRHRHGDAGYRHDEERSPSPAPHYRERRRYHDGTRSYEERGSPYDRRYDSSRGRYDGQRSQRPRRKRSISPYPPRGTGRDTSRERPPPPYRERERIRTPTPFDWDQYEDREERYRPPPLHRASREEREEQILAGRGQGMSGRSTRG